MTTALGLALCATAAAPHLGLGALLFWWAAKPDREDDLHHREWR